MNLPKRKRYIRSLLRAQNPALAPRGCARQSPDSPCHLIGNGSRLRYPKNEKNKRHLTPIRVQRYLCQTHQRHLTFIPSKILPRIHYAAEIVNRSVQKHLDRPVHRELLKPHWKTVKRWVDRLVNHLDKNKNKALKHLGFLDSQAELGQRLLVRSGLPPKFQVWTLLKEAAKTEDRVPYHVVLSG